MSQSVNDSHYTMEQLYSMLQQVNEVQSPARYAALAAEIERRVASSETLGSRPNEGKDKKTTAFIVVEIIAKLQYGLVVLAGAVWPMLNFIWNRDENSFLVLFCIIITFFFMFAVLAGYRGMQRFLDSASDQMTVKMWARVAAVLAPYSAIFYTYMGYQVLLLRNVISGLGFFDGLLIYIIGFYMPFILLTLWLRYKFRQDEF
jgi:hypothetical protein